MTIETANRLLELRKKHNLSQEELAEKLGVSRQAVSKWERSEASPDTDNLIALAKIYNLSLDELIYGKKEEKSEEVKEDPKEEPKTESGNDDETLFINIDDGDDKVKIGPAGIYVESSDGEKVKISLSGIKIETSKKGNDDFDDDLDDLDDDLEDLEDIDDDDDDTETVYEKENGHIHIKVNKPVKKTRLWLAVPYPIICVIAYLLCGFYNVLGGWALSWVIFLTIPIYYSFVEAIYERRFSDFAYPVLMAFIYLVLGMYYGNWHPSWIVFVTIPIYYPIAEALDRKIRESGEARNK